MKKTKQTTNLRIFRNQTQKAMYDVVEVDRRGNILYILHTGLTLDQSQAIVDCSKDEESRDDMR